MVTTSEESKRLLEDLLKDRRFLKYLDHILYEYRFSYKYDKIAKDLERLLLQYPLKERTISLLLEIIKGYKSPDYDTMKLDKVMEEIGRWAVRNYCKNEIYKVIENLYSSDKKIDKQTFEQIYEQILNKINPEEYIIIGDRILGYLTLHVLNFENVHRYVMRERESQNSHNYE